MEEIRLAGRDFPWAWIQGHFLLFEQLLPFSEVNGDRVGKKILGTHGTVKAQLANPDVDVQMRSVWLPIQNKTDFLSIYRADLDQSVQNGSVQLILLYEGRKSFLGGAKPSLHIGAFTTGVWDQFLAAVDSYSASSFRWPDPLFIFQPGHTKVFPESPNTIRL